MDALSVAYPGNGLLRVVMAGRYPLADRAHEVQYRHPTHALHLHEVGGVLRRDGVDERFEASELVISYPHHVTSYALDRPQRLWCIHFEPGPGCPTRASVPSHVRLGSNRPYVVDRLARIARWHASASSDPLAKALASTLLLEVLLVLAQLASPQAEAPRRRSHQSVIAAATWIEAHACDTLDVTRLASQNGVSHPYLARRFHEHFGMTLKRFQMGCRIDQARHLLMFTDIAVQHLARQLGFSDTQHFSKNFARLVGMSPGRFRKTSRHATPS